MKVRKLREDAVLPMYACKGDAGMDVVAVEKVMYENFVEYKTGLAFEIPKGYVMLIFPRSSVTKTDSLLGNSVGVLDSGYRGELSIRFKILGQRGCYEVGDRVAQIMILPYPEVEFEEVLELGESIRGEGGFGSTGR